MSITVTCFLFFYYLHYYIISYRHIVLHIINFTCDRNTNRTDERSYMLYSELHLLSRGDLFKFLLFQMQVISWFIPDGYSCKHA